VQSRGDTIVERPSGDLRLSSSPGATGFSTASLWRMRQLHLTFTAPDFLAQPVREIKLPHPVTKTPPAPRPAKLALAVRLHSGIVSTGASDDLKRASELSINMVGPLGFSEAFGLLGVAGVAKELLGPDIQAAVLKEARLLLEKSQATCRRLLRTHRKQLDALATRLLEREVLSGDELAALLGSNQLVSTLAV
jgi:Peptidase family M41